MLSKLHFQVKCIVFNYWENIIRDKNIMYYYLSNKTAKIRK